MQKYNLIRYLYGRTSLSYWRTTSISRRGQGECCDKRREERGGNAKSSVSHTVCVPGCPTQCVPPTCLDRWDPAWVVKCTTWQRTSSGEGIWGRKRAERRLNLKIQEHKKSASGFGFAISPTKSSLSWSKSFFRYLAWDVECGLWYPAYQGGAGVDIWPWLVVDGEVNTCVQQTLRL